jgi:hypothetical protein
MLPLPLLLLLLRAAGCGTEEGGSGGRLHTVYRERGLGAANQIYGLYSYSYSFISAGCRRSRRGSRQVEAAVGGGW